MSAAARIIPVQAILWLLLGFSACSCSGDSDGADQKVFLEVRISNEIGKVATSITFRDGRREVTSMVLEQTIRTGRPGGSGKIGDFGEVYEAVTGKMPGNPGELQSVEAIFDGAREAGWNWEEDKNPPRQSNPGERTVYRLWR